MSEFEPLGTPDDTPQDDGDISPNRDESEATPEEETEVEEEEKPRSREQKYRLALRETQAELQNIQTRLDAAHTREIEAMATGLADPKDLWVIGLNTVEDLLSEETGQPDPEKVDAAVKAITATRPGLSKYARAVDMTQGMHSQGNGTPSWSDLLRD